MLEHTHPRLRCAGQRVHVGVRWWRLPVLLPGRAEMQPGHEAVRNSTSVTSALVRPFARRLGRLRVHGAVRLRGRARVQLPHEFVRVANV